MAKKEYPKTLYVKWEESSVGEEFLNPSANITELAVLGETTEIAEYRLVAVRKAVNRTKIVD